MLCSLDRSSGSAKASPPRLTMAAATASALATLRAAQATVAPASASTSQAAEPIGLDAPETSATRPSSRNICSTLTPNLSG